MSPYSGNSFKVNVPPGEDKIVLIKMSGNWNMSSSRTTRF